MIIEGLVLGGGEEMDLAGESVAVGVEAGAMLALFGLGPVLFNALKRLASNCAMDVILAPERRLWGRATT